MTPTASSLPLVAIELLASSVWTGGLVAIFIVARVASEMLDAHQRVRFFRALGRSYGIVGTPALIVALGAGALLLRGHPWTSTQVAATIVAAALVGVTAAGIGQARAMTRLRQRALVTAGSDRMPDEVRRGARLATALRGAIALLTVILLVIAAALAAGR